MTNIAGDAHKPQFLQASLVLYQWRQRVAVRVCSRRHLLSVDMHRKLGVQQDAAVCKCVGRCGWDVIDSNVLYGWACVKRYHDASCAVQAVTPTRLKPFLSRLSMRTAPSKQIARARWNTLLQNTRAHHALPCCVRCARHVHCVRARMCLEQLLHRTARDARTVQTHRSSIAMLALHRHCFRHHLQHRLHVRPRWLLGDQRWVGAGRRVCKHAELG